MKQEDHRRDLMNWRAPWLRLYYDSEVILAEFLVLCVVLLLFYGLTWIVRRPLSLEHGAIVDSIFIWYTVALLVIFPIKSAFTILRSRERSSEVRGKKGVRAKDELWRAVYPVQIIVADFVVIGVIFLAIYGPIWLLSSSAFSEQHRALINSVYGAYALGLLIIFPVKSAYTILRSPTRSSKAKSDEVLRIEEEFRAAESLQELNTRAEEAREALSASVEDIAHANRQADRLFAELKQGRNDGTV